MGGSGGDTGTTGHARRGPGHLGRAFFVAGARGSTTGDAVDHAEPQQIGRPQLEHVRQVGHVLL